MVKKIILVFMLAVFSLSVGCVSKQYRVNPEFSALSKEIRNPILAHPKVEVYELSAGGMRVLKEEWCTIGRVNVTGAVLQNLQGIKYQIMDKGLSPEMEEKIEDLLSLYAAVSLSIQVHAMNGQSPQAFPTKMQNFDYSIGPIDDILEELEADGMILVYGSDEISTTGRQALIAAGIIAGAATGTYGAPRSGITRVNASVIDPNGKIIWYSSKVSAGQHDLRNRESVDSLIQQLFADFPLTGS
jgi:hypothetical protein